jgi:hypothetical protein
MSIPLEASVARFLLHLQMFLVIGLHVTIALVDLLSVFILFCSSASRGSCDEQI